MPIKALSFSDTKEYESELDDAKGTDAATKFKIGAIAQRAYAILKDKASKCSADPNNPDGIVMDFRPNDIAFDIFRLGVKDIKNFSDETGEIEFKTIKQRFGDYLYDAVHMDIMNRIPLEVIREVALEIRKMNEITEEEEKNSEG